MLGAGRSLRVGGGWHVFSCWFAGKLSNFNTENSLITSSCYLLNSQMIVKLMNGFYVILQFNLLQVVIYDVIYIMLYTMSIIITYLCELRILKMRH